MYILTPIPITEAMLGAGTTVTEPAPGETEWVSGGTYALGDLRIRPQTHRVYECVQAHTGRTALPENDPLYWKDKAPTQRHAPFDLYISTAATGTTSQTWVIKAGFCTALSIYGAAGGQAEITVKDAPGGATLRHVQQSLYRDAPGLWEYLFTPARPLNKILLTDLPIRPELEITITLTGETVGVGMIIVGYLQSVIEGAEWGGTEAGATATPTTNSYIKSDGETVEIQRRGAGTDIDLSVVLPTSIADTAVRRLQDVLDVPVTVLGSKTPGFDGLNTYGLITSASVKYQGPKISRLTAKVEGMF